jgi:hypothetical protein
MIARIRASIGALTPTQQKVCLVWLVLIGPITVGLLIWAFARWNGRLV